MHPMGVLDIVNHLLNFLAPAVAVAVLTVVFSRIFMKKMAGVPVFWMQFAINIVASACVLLAGLWFFGRDGKMATYAAPVLVKDWQRMETFAARSVDAQ